MKVNQVYFDTNVYSHIYRSQYGITAGDVAKLRKAVDDGKIRIFTSLTVIEETNMARLDDLEEANGRLELIRTLADTEEIIRFHPDILEDDIRAYANNSPFRSKFEKPSRGVKSIFFDHTKRNYLELDKVAADTKIMIAAYGNQMDVIFKKAHPQADADKQISNNRLKTIGKQWLRPGPNRWPIALVS